MPRLDIAAAFIMYLDFDLKLLSFWQKKTSIIIYCTLRCRIKRIVTDLKLNLAADHYKERDTRKDIARFMFLFIIELGSPYQNFTLSVCIWLGPLSSESRLWGSRSRRCRGNFWPPAPRFMFLLPGNLSPPPVPLAGILDGRAPENKIKLVFFSLYKVVVCPLGSR